jgi:hypothetical protein
MLKEGDKTEKKIFFPVMFLCKEQKAEGMGIVRGSESIVF